MFLISNNGKNNRNTGNRTPRFSSLYLYQEFRQGHMKILIIGAGPGLSRSIATLFGQQGFEATLVSRNEAKLKEEILALKAAGIKADYVIADAGDEDSLATFLKNMIETNNVPDMILYNASAPVQKGIEEESWENLKKQFDVNVGGAFNLIKGLLPALKQQGKGKLFFTGGGFGIDPNPDLVGLSMGKAALRNLVQATAKKLEGTNIHAATVTIYGFIGGPDPKYAPDTIAELFWKLYQQPKEDFEVEVIY